MITVKELINKLKKLPPDFTVASHTILEFDPDNRYSLIDGYAEPFISVEVEKKLVKIKGDCDKEPIESNFAPTNRYEVARTKSGWYGTYDLQDKVFVGTLYPGWERDSYEKAKAFCDELTKRKP